MTECSTFVLSFSSACSRRRKGKFLIGVPTRTQAGPWAGGRWWQAPFDLPSELVTQVDGTVSGCLADASDRCDVLPGELGVRWRHGAIEKAAHGHFELAPMVQGDRHG